MAMFVPFGSFFTAVTASTKSPPVDLQHLVRRREAGELIATALKVRGSRREHPDVAGRLG
jgi:hypothetical protein